MHSGYEFEFDLGVGKWLDLGKWKGLSLQLGKSARRHDLHHEKFEWNFGGWWVLDTMHGTEWVGKEEEGQQVVN